MTKLGYKLKNAAQRAMILGTSAMYGLSAKALDISTDYEVNQDADASKALGGLIGLVIFAFRIGGIVDMIIGFATFAKTFKENNGDKRGQAIAEIVSGFIILMIPTFLKSIGVLN